MAVRTASTVLAALAAASAAWGQCDSLTTAFNGTVSLTARQNSGNMFDVTALRQELTICSFDVNSHGPAGAPNTIQVYYKEGTFVGFETDPGAWTKLGEETGIAQGVGNPTPLPIGGLVIPQGRTFGIYINFVDESPRYSSSSAMIPIHSNADLEIELGNAVNGLFGASSIISPRGWNGTVHYRPGGVVCYPDCDGNGTLDFFDFLCFQNAFLAQDPYADCDQNGVFDFFDFLCFQNEFLAGCP